MKTLFPNPKLTGFDSEVKKLSDRMKLFTVYNPKLTKSTKLNYISAALMLSPAYLSGWEVCKYRTTGCTRSCLNTSGYGGIVRGGASSMEEVVEKSNYAQKARLHRTELLYAKTPERTVVPIITNAFGEMLLDDIDRLNAFAKKHKMKPCVRLNGTSDLPWESMPMHGRKNLMWFHKDIQFYDYTKWPVDERPGIPENYYMIYSWNEQKVAEQRARRWLAHGCNVAAVFSTRKGQPLPKYHEIAKMDFPVVDGDVSDLRFLDPRPVIVGLRAKGFAKQDTTGFVIQVPRMNPAQQELDFEGGVLFPDLS